MINGIKVKIMELTTFNFWGKTKYWWGIMLVGSFVDTCGVMVVVSTGYGICCHFDAVRMGIDTFRSGSINCFGRYRKARTRMGLVACWRNIRYIYRIFVDQQFGIERIRLFLIFSLLYFCLRDLAILFLHFL